MVRRHTIKTSIGEALTKRGGELGENLILDVTRLSEYAGLQRRALAGPDRVAFAALQDEIANGRRSATLAPVAWDPAAEEYTARAGLGTPILFVSSENPSYTWTRGAEVDARDEKGACREAAEALGSTPGATQQTGIALSRAALDCDFEPLAFGVHAIAANRFVTHAFYAFSSYDLPPAEDVARILKSYLARFWPSSDILIVKEGTTRLGSTRRSSVIEIEWCEDSHYIHAGTTYQIGGPPLTTSRNAYARAPPGARVLVRKAATSPSTPAPPAIKVIINAEATARALNSIKWRGVL